MLFLIAGLFKPGSDEQAVELHDEWKEQQTQGRISLAGVLRGRRGRRVGYVGFIEAKDFDDAETYFKQSPFRTNRRYAQSLIAQFDPDVGSIGK